jgi:putative ABC transport system permease protein
MNAAALPGPAIDPDFYLGRVAAGSTVPAVAAEVRRAAPAYTVMTIDQQVLPEQRTLTVLNLRALSRLEAAAAGLVAAVGVAVLGAFLVLERRREAAVLRSVGATTAQSLTGPGVEGAVAVFGSLLIGVPVGIGLAVLSIRVLGLFFTLPLADRGAAGRRTGDPCRGDGGSVPRRARGGLHRVGRQAPAAVLREP